MDSNIPLYEFFIDDTIESGVKTVSIVNDPAFESKLIAFNKTTPQFVALQGEDKLKRKVLGLAIIPNTPVFREDPDTGQKYFGFFSADTIEKIVEKFHTEMNNNNVNLDHNPDAYIDAVLVEDFIVDSNARVQDLKEKGIEHPNIFGAWATTYKIQDKKVFDTILNGEGQIGFSIEAFLDRILIQMNQEINNNFKKQIMKSEKKNILEKIVALFKEDEPQKFERALVPELGLQIEWNEVGAPVLQVTVDEEGVETTSHIGPGEFVTDAGVIVVDDSSNLVEVREIPAVEIPVEEVPVEEVPMEVPAISLEDDPIIPEVPVEEVPVEEVPVEPVVEEVPVVEEPVVEVPEVKVKTIGEIVGDQDGEYHIKVVVSEGMVTEAEVSSETNLLKEQLTKLTTEKQILEEKLKEPIAEPQLEAEIVKKDFKDMSAYEKVMYKRNLEK
ncbi:MAG: XkdF-like putative serine protease domain-containing protein [Candidatus Heimdallarchaeota archaeon]